MTIGNFVTSASANSCTRRFIIGLARPASSARRSKLAGVTRSESVCGRRGQPYRDPQCIEHGEDLAELAGGFPLFQFNNEPQACTRGHGQGPLRDRKALACSFYQFANLFSRRFHGCSLCYRTGTLSLKHLKASTIFPIGNYLIPSHPKGRKITAREYV